MHRNELSVRAHCHSATGRQWHWHCNCWHRFEALAKNKSAGEDTIYFDNTHKMTAHTGTRGRRPALQCALNRSALSSFIIRAGARRLRPRATGPHWQAEPGWSTVIKLYCLAIPLFFVLTPCVVGAQEIVHTRGIGDRETWESNHRRHDHATRDRVPGCGSPHCGLSDHGIMMINYDGHRKNRIVDSRDWDHAYAGTTK